MTDESVGLKVRAVDPTILEYFFFVSIFIVFDYFIITITIHISWSLTMEIVVKW